MGSLRMSTIEETTLQASKWQKCQVLLDSEEMENLFESLGEFELYRCGSVTPEGESLLSQAQFLEKYQEYVSELKKGGIPDVNVYRPFFSAIMTSTPDAIFAIPVEGNKELVRVAKPIVQLQVLNVHYSTLDGKFHGGVFGKDSIVWGLQFSYPQLYQDPKTKQVEQVRNDTKQFPNSLLFSRLQKWMRQNSIPTPFIAQGVKVNVPIRIGKRALSWINTHPQLIRENLSVDTTLVFDES